MYADVDAGAGDGVDEIIAGVTGAATIFAHTLTVRANSDETLLADSTSGTGGVIALAGCIARTTSDMATLATIASGAFVRCAHTRFVYRTQS